MVQPPHAPHGPRMTHPGEVLLDWIVESGNTQSQLAEQLGVSLKHINHIVRGKALYSEDLALRLGEVTDRTARYWAELRLNYRLAEAESRQAERNRQ